MLISEIILLRHSLYFAMPADPLAAKESFREHQLMQSCNHQCVYIIHIHQWFEGIALQKVIEQMEHAITLTKRGYLITICCSSFDF